MPHRCARCGKEFPSDHEALLKGCDACGARKFIFSGPGEDSRAREMPLRERGQWPPLPQGRHTPDQIVADAGGPGEKTVEETTHPTPSMETAGPPADKDTDHEMVESIRILSPGSYELNIAKMADSDERIVGIGKGGNYLVDLVSMIKSKKTGRKE